MGRGVMEEKTIIENDNVRIEVAREIMNAMIGHYGQNGYDINNKALMQLFIDEQLMIKFDFKVIDKIINEYGPMIKYDNYTL